MSDKMRDDAIREAARNHAGDEYFNADRAYLLVSPYSGRIFDAGFDRGWQAAQAEQSAPVVGDVVEWQYRWLNPEEYKDQPASLLQWERVVPRLKQQSTENRLDELLAYRSHGKACYEIRALIVQPTTSITAAELDALRKDAERYRWLREQAWNKSELCVVRFPKDAVKLGHVCPSFWRLDSFIDAAIEDEKK